MKNHRAYDKATQIVQILQKAGHTAYFAGGWVRDYLMGHPSDDIDIATDAPLDTIRSLFEKTVEVGAQFGILIVVFEDIPFEVATFRQDLGYEDGRKPTGILKGTAEQDAERRDFTINGMFYDPVADKVIDYVGGKKDLERQLVRTIGDPNERIGEDRLRMIRAIRFVARFNFTATAETEEAIYRYSAQLFPAVSIERVWQELQKMAAYPGTKRAYVLLHTHNLLQQIFPETTKLTTEEIEKRLPVDKLPAIAYVTLLFPEKTPQDMVQLCRRLRTSNRDQALAALLARCRLLAKDKNTSSGDWCRFYVDPSSQQSLDIVALTLEPSAQKPFLLEHKERQKKLMFHIDALRRGAPVVTSEHLKNEGIPPGKKMGFLLKNAETIAINNDLRDPQAVLNILKSSDAWSNR